MKRLAMRVLIVAAVCVAPVGLLARLTAQHGPRTAGLLSARIAGSTCSADSSRPSRPQVARLAPITIDYPAEGSVFPPEITPPTFVWRDAAERARVWLIDVAFADGSAGIQAESRGERLRIGEIDPRCFAAESNELPKLTPQQAAARTWKPDNATWETIKKHSTKRSATVTITGYADDNLVQAVSQGRVVIQTSKDPVGAPIFYRDLPLMPNEGVG